MCVVLPTSLVAVLDVIQLPEVVDISADITSRSSRSLRQLHRFSQCRTLGIVR
ncbi:hypothetical protein PF005_g6701 [Phytophthora fragariae]|uniref:Uncharacterized protein n=1 Tax=Phytophthora fragariae TaxID=53985 RepID=A0A6A3LKW1_9STRA|nr:hypothetical protein PF003_g38219 [Phytophthora fragariae]KAE8881472.1 hypothetical protein PF003_g34557 [Phytophthora fragariae]KAE8942838.1 hypothetical protein PF009_g7429 [Phytophthora fragariae]KAE9020042.1 hypothetical protein PF011_g5591 [Phytophthora fragariae]KAE9123976.1 hypothetical protein PF007_g6880 [Phytophthora fragariae]